MNPIPPPEPQTGIVARALSGHALLGVAVATFLYILCLSGTIAVFTDELRRWEHPNVPEFVTISPEAVARAAESFLTAERADTSHYVIELPTAEKPRLTLRTDTESVHADRDGTILGKEQQAWTRFLLDLHYYLHLPGVWGLTVVGIFGVMLLSLTITGFMAHPRVFRDAFKFRYRGSERLVRADLHNRLGVWTAPFHIAIAFTGAMIALSSAASFIIGASGFDGDREAVFGSVFGPEPAPDSSPAPLPDMAAALHVMEKDFPEVTATHVLMHHPGTRGQDLQIIARHPNRLVFGEYYNFDADGRFIGAVGLANGTLGQQVAASVYSVHFGDYGGLMVKIAYAVLGIGLTVMISSGISVFHLRRRQQGRPLPLLEKGWDGVVWGTPAALAVTLAMTATGLNGGRLLSLSFWALLGAGILCVFLVGRVRARRVLPALTTTALIIAVGFHHITEKTVSASSHDSIVSLVLLAVALTILLAGIRKQTPSVRNTIPACE